MNNVNGHLGHGIFRTVFKGIRGAKHSPELNIVVFVDVVEKFYHKLQLRVLQVVWVEAIKVALVQLFVLLPSIELKKEKMLLLPNMTSAHWIL